MGFLICSDFVLVCLFYSDFPWGTGRVVTVFAHRKREGFFRLLSLHPFVFCFLNDVQFFYMDGYPVGGHVNDLSDWKKNVNDWCQIKFQAQYSSKGSKADINEVQQSTIKCQINSGSYKKTRTHGILFPPPDLKSNNK